MVALTSDAASPRAGSGGAIALALVGVIPYALMLATLHFGPPGGAPASYGGEGRIAEAFAELYTLVFGALTWSVLGGLTVIAVRSGLPDRARTLAMLLYPASAVAAFAGGAAVYDFPGGWSILVPAVAPTLIAVGAIWLRAPRLRALVSVERASLAGLAALAAVCAATVPLRILDEAQLPARIAAYQKKNAALAAAAEAEQARRDQDRAEKFASLTADSSFADHLEYVTTYLPEAEHERAIAGMRQASGRLAAVVALLRAERPNLYQLNELWRFDLRVTPELCRAYAAALINEANADAFDTNVGEYLEDQLPNMRFFVRDGCDLDAALDAAAARVQKIIVAMGNADAGRQRWDDFEAAVAALRQAR